MSENENTEHGWRESISTFLHPRVITMLFFGFSAGIPILLIFSSLSLWLREAGVERSAATFFSWAALGYSFKFVWAPLVDKLPVPWLTKLVGRRRSWILVSQVSIMVAILWMASTNPLGGGNQLTVMALAAVLLGFSSATQDIVIDAYRIESAGSDLQTMMASTYIAGYRIGMLVAGAGALVLASYFGSTKQSYSYEAWQWTYIIMAGTMLVGVVTALVVPEPEIHVETEQKYDSKDYSTFLLLFLFAIVGFILTFWLSGPLATSVKKSLKEVFGNRHLASFLVETVRLGAGAMVAIIIAKAVMVSGLVNRTMVKETYVEPIKDFFSRYGRTLAWLLLALVGLYRISDIVLGVISNVFYQDLGFTKLEIASIVKTFGLFMTIAGGFIGGIFSARYGVVRILFVGAVLSAATNLLFMIQANLGHNVPMLYIVISADNLAGGLASAAFVAFLSSLVNVKFTAVQYAIFTSLMTLLPKILGGYSGTVVDGVGYQTFFLITALIGIPVLFLIMRVQKLVKINS